LIFPSLKNRRRKNLLNQTTKKKEGVEDELARAQAQAVGTAITEVKAEGVLILLKKSLPKKKSKNKYAKP
jgi:hypothetical protein